MKTFLRNLKYDLQTFFRTKKKQRILERAEVDAELAMYKAATKLVVNDAVQKTKEFNEVLAAAKIDNDMAAKLLLAMRDRNG